MAVGERELDDIANIGGDSRRVEDISTRSNSDLDSSSVRSGSKSKNGSDLNHIGGIKGYAKK